MKLTLKKILSTFIFLVIVTLLVCLIARGIVVNKAQKNADLLHQNALVSLADPYSEDAYLERLTHLVFTSFESVNPSDLLMLRLRPYLTSRFLPGFVSLPSGVIETNVQAGFCDNAARMLAFILNEQGYQTAQWNMVSKSGGHSALRVEKKNGDFAFLDPFYGVVAKHKGKLISLEDAQILAKTTKNVRQLIIPLTDNSKTKFYKNLTSLHMAAEGENLVLNFIIPRITKDFLTIGEVDGSPRDVISAGNKNNISGYWHYIGHKYNREWIRVLTAQVDTKIVMTLIDDQIDHGVLTSSVKPKIDGKELIWILKAGENLTMEDTKAKISWQRLNSFQEIDQIKFYPL